MDFFEQFSSSSSSDNDDFSFLSSQTPTKKVVKKKISSSTLVSSVTKKKGNFSSALDTLTQLSQKKVEEQENNPTEPVENALDSNTSCKPDSSASTNTTSTTLPLTFDKVKKRGSTLLVQLEDSALEFTGDSGAIGRLHAKNRKNGSVGSITVDIKGQQYTGEIVPTNTFFVVSVGSTDARVEAVVDSFVQISRKKSVFNSIQGVVTEGKMEDTLLENNDDDSFPDTKKRRKGSR